MAGGDAVNRYGLQPGSNLGNLGKGSVIIVVACDLHEEAPLWWLRVHEAVKRGAELVVINTRPTRLDKFANHKIRITIGREAKAVDALLTGDMADTLKQAENLVIFYGSDGLGRKATGQLAAASARLLQASGHDRKVNSGLIPVWERGNTQGLWDMGGRPVPDIAGLLAGAKVVLMAGVDPAKDDPLLERALEKAEFLVVQELLPTQPRVWLMLFYPCWLLPNVKGRTPLANGECSVFTLPSPHQRMVKQIMRLLPRWLASWVCQWNPAQHRWFSSRSRPRFRNTPDFLTRSWRKQRNSGRL